MNVDLTRLPEMAVVKQKLYARPIKSIPAAVHKQMKNSGAAGRFRAGERIAVTAGSRGVANLAEILRCVVTELKALGAEPFVIPAMGSHGGATAEGQLAVLESLGVNEKTVGAPLVSTMDVVQIGHTPAGVPVYMNRPAFEADGVVAVNRIKPHTDFKAPIESGLMKMLSIGLGKRAQAEAIHALGISGLTEAMPEVARVVLASGKIRLGLGIVEDGYHQTSELEAAAPEQMEAMERRLLRKIKRHFPGLPADEIDILIVDQIGKDISGTGMDPNVMGRIAIQGVNWISKPAVHTLLALDLTETTHGNALGVGFADFTVRRLADQIDWHATYTNTLVAGFLERMKLPYVCENDRQAVESAVFHNSRRRPEDLRILRIRDTLHIEELAVSLPLLREIPAERILSSSPRPPLAFDAAGALLPVV